MQEVTIDKACLLKKLKENKAEHEAAFHEASAAFYEQFTTKLEEAAQGVRAKKLNFTAAQKLAFWEMPPQGHCDEYDRVISMLEFEKRNTITLTPQEFAQYVRDDWGWKQNFAASYHAHTHKILGQ